jgi:HlyD family secretion protein
MDIARPSMARQKRIKRIIYGAVAALAVGGITMALYRLKPAAPTVEAATLWPDTVKRGPMLVQVRGLGTLVPEDIRWITAQSNARVEKIVLRSGATVNPDSIILELSDPQLQSDAAAAAGAFNQAAADYENTKASLNSQLMSLQTQLAQYQGLYNVDKKTYEVDKQKLDGGVGAKFDMEIAQARMEQDFAQLELEKKVVTAFADTSKAQLASQQAKLDSAQAAYSLKKAQLDALHVRAHIKGVLQCVCTASGTNIEEGQTVTLGTNMARVADPTRLKATVQIPETQAKDVLLMQKAEVDTRNGIVPGHVTRVDASVVNGTRGVDISLDGALPSGAVPDLSVDGTITTSNLQNVLYVGRPVHGEPNSTVGIFKYTPDGRDAYRTSVSFGLASVNAIEIKSGLKEGDKVILSDMSTWDAVDHVRVQ